MSHGTFASAALLAASLVWCAGCSVSEPVDAADAENAVDAAPKVLPLPGEQFELDGCAAFVIEPEATADGGGPRPWVFYAPTLHRYPDRSERWMFERLLDAGITIAGIDVGESYGSPAGRRHFDALHDHMVRQRGMSTRPVLLARSRGGLMLYAWAAGRPEHVAGIAGIYPVCDLRSYPGLERAAGAYGVDAAQLERELAEHNPIDRLAPLVRHGVPILHLHGDADRLVPLAANSGELQRRYRALGGNATVEVVAGGGHTGGSQWFESETLLAFVVERCSAPPSTTAGVLGVCDPRCPDGALQLVGASGWRLVPEGDGECRWTFADGVLTASSGSDSVMTAGDYRDFRLHVEFNVNPSTDDNPEARGNSGVYLQRRYELQILDSYGTPPEHYQPSFCASLYRLRKPDHIAARPAGEWQSYDIVFRAARFDGDQKTENARISVVHNGQLVHDDVEIPRKTGAGAAEGPSPGPIKLQGHGNPVRFRNVWVQELSLGR